MTADLAPLRQRYADLMTAPLQGADRRLREAFATVPREAFLGPPPWMVRGAFHPLSTSDPADLYHDVLVALNEPMGLNNGSPSLHALMLHRLGVQPGQRVLHVGAGGGYYTAIIAELAGPTGAVTAVEFDAALAQAATHNLRPWPWVSVIQGDGAAFPTTPTDRIYVNFALADPADAWLDHLAVGGRLLFPLAGRDGVGEMLLLSRTDEREFAARFLCQVQFVPCIGAQNELAGRALQAAFKRGHPNRVRRLVRDDAPGESSWLAGDGWWLG